jgi:creatinine amidohydrolase/Fe(II)-dependent formamide hydrolase-like protein
MQLHLLSWPEVERYLKTSKTILIPIGSTEQHGPTGLMGTDAICAEVIGRRAGAEAQIMVAPTFNVGQAQHHMAFPGTMTLRPSTMIAAMVDWARSLSHHGFERLYWLNGHGGNIATMTAAFSEIYHGASLSEAKGSRLLCRMRNWWELPGVGDTCRQFFPVGEGHHATPSEISVTYYAHPQAQKQAKLEPKIAPFGPINDAADYRRRFPDGRIGSDPSQANPEAGEKIVAAAVKAVVEELRSFAEEREEKA